MDKFSEVFVISDVFHIPLIVVYASHNFGGNILKMLTDERNPIRSNRWPYLYNNRGVCI